MCRRCKTVDIRNLKLTLIFVSKVNAGKWELMKPVHAFYVAGVMSNTVDGEFHCFVYSIDVLTCDVVFKMKCLMEWHERCCEENFKSLNCLAMLFN